MKLPSALVSAVARNWPFANGVGRFVDRFSDAGSLGDGVRTCVTTDRLPLDVFENDHIGRHIILSGQFDRTPVQVLIDFARPGDVILDIGANIGYVSCVLLENIPDSRVTCIEPQPDVAELLRTNLGRFPEGRSSVLELALSDADGDISLNVDTKNRGASSIHLASDGGSIRVRTMSASALLGNMPKLDLVKIDVEGHEEAILRSALGQIDRLRPRAILFEDREGKSHPQGAIGELLGSIGYRVYGIAKSIFGTKLVPVLGGADCEANDYIALPQESGSTIPGKYS